LDKTVTLDAINDPVANLDLNGYKIKNSGTLLVGDSDDTLTTKFWVQTRDDLYYGFA
jgi:hypothetical protein